MNRYRLQARRTESGTTAVEFSLLALIFFTFVFGIFEFTRILFVYNTLQEVTRRAASSAANIYPLDDTALNQARQAAVFRDSPGQLALAPPVTDQYVRIDYLGLTRASDGSLSMTPISQSSLPSCAAVLRQICMDNPNAANCVRFVRVRICDPAHTDVCSFVTSGLVMPLVPLPVPLPKATTITPVESLGYRQGTMPCAPAS
jgi:hypothetical protein